MELSAHPRRDLEDEALALDLLRANFEMRIPRPAQGAGAEQRAPQVRRTATPARDDPLGRPLERPVRGVEHARPMKRSVRVRRALDVQLVAGRVIERVPLVRADLRIDVERAQKAERAPGDPWAHEVEMDVDDAAAAQVNAAGHMEEPRELCITVAVRLGRACLCLTIYA